MLRKRPGIPKPAAPATEPVSERLTKLLGRIEFQPENVVSAAAENSMLFAEAIQYRVDCLRKRNAARMCYERLRAQTDSEIRAEARDANLKITNPEVEAMLTLNTALEEENRRFLHAEEEEEYSKLLVEVFRMRRDCLRIVENATREEVTFQRAAEEGAERAQEIRRRLRERFSGEEGG